MIRSAAPFLQKSLRLRRMNERGGTMTKQLLSQDVKDQFDAMRDLLGAALALAQKSSDTEAAKIVQDRLAHLQSPALFVIIGEVKSGKSSFVNALLGEDVCDVAPDPCTACIQELVYADERSRTDLGLQWERIALPREVLREITIVDTPGTNSVIRNHQTITENYIPLSDLVVFVFPAKNPHTGSAWDLLALIRKDWHRKTVFVLQQSDLATQHELAINRERVAQYARERNVQDPVVFTVSAKREAEGASDSGFTEFRDFLRKTVETGDVWRMKVEGARETAAKIALGIIARLSAARDALAEDRIFYGDLMGRVKARRDKADALRRLAVDSLCVSYDRLASSLEADFTEGLSVGTILRRAIPLVRDKDVKTWLAEIQSDFENKSKTEIDAESSRVSKDIANEMMSMFTELTEAIARRRNDAQPGISAKDTDRVEILSRLQRQLQELRVADIVSDKAIQGSDIGKLSLAGGGLAAFGAVIALATKMVAFDITGGILALAGAGLIAVTLIWKRSSLLSEVSQKLRKSRAEFRDRLDKEIARIFENLFVEIEHCLKEPLSRLDEQTQRLESLLGEAERVKEMAQKI
jgi:ribosome biogenesis GTPase A